MSKAITIIAWSFAGFTAIAGASILFHFFDPNPPEVPGNLSNTKMVLMFNKEINTYCRYPLFKIHKANKLVFDTTLTS